MTLHENIYIIYFEINKCSKQKQFDIMSLKGIIMLLSKNEKFSSKYALFDNFHRHFQTNNINLKWKIRAQETYICSPHGFTTKYHRLFPSIVYYKSNLTVYTYYYFNLCFLCYLF